ncbi:MAG: O-antigen ligase family protein, partial [Flavobacteriales bacterium]
MVRFLKGNWQFLLVGVIWGVLGYLAPSATFVLMPLSVMFFKSRDLWPEILFGLLIVLVISDLNPNWFYRLMVYKDSKNLYVAAMAAFFLIETNRFAPLSAVFKVFIPFFAYSWFPLVFSDSIVVGIQKTISYALMFMVVPNYLLYSYRRRGWEFFRSLIYFMTAILLVGFLLNWPGMRYSYLMGRLRGMFGNPNGLGIFCYLMIVLFSVLNAINRNLFNWRERLLIFAIVIYCLVETGSRASLASAGIFLAFNRFFAFSPFLGFVGLIFVFLMVEVVSSNIVAIITSLGLEKYFRLETLEEGSGRYFAWNFAWEHVQRYLVFGGGFSNDETIMRRYRLYLESQGHQGGVHNTYLSMWLNVGFVGLLIFLRSFFLLFYRASKLVPMSLAIMFSVLFSIMYES